MRKLERFKDLNKKDAVFWAINIATSVFMSALCIVLAFYYGLVFNWNNRLGSAIGMIFASLIPIAFELITRRRLPNMVFLLVNVYIFFAGVLGSALNVYYLLSWYDVLIHCVMGYAIAMLALFFLCRMGEHKKMKAITIALFCLFFSLGIELLWEIFERILDVYFGQTAQGIKVEGTNSPLVADTIEDLICNFSGAFLFFVHFVVDRYAKLNLGFTYIMKDFAGERSEKVGVIAPPEKTEISSVENKEESDPEKVQVKQKKNKTIRKKE